MFCTNGHIYICFIKIFASGGYSTSTPKKTPDELTKTKHSKITTPVYDAEQPVLELQLQLAVDVSRSEWE